MSTRKLIASFAALALVMGLSVSTVMATSFTDDASISSWAKSSVESLVSQGVIQGYADGRFGPQDNMTRAQFAKVALLSAGETVVEQPTATSFPDVDSNAWYSAYVKKAADLGIIGGYQNGNFGPNDPVTRSQAAKMLVNAFGLELDATNGPSFPDVASSAWYYSYVETAYKWSVINGYGSGNFGPDDNITREQVGTMAVRAQNPVDRFVTTPVVPEDVLGVADADSTSSTEVEVTFNKELDSTTAEDAANYSIAGLTISGAELGSGSKIVTLTTSTQTSGTSYTVVVSDVKDMTGELTVNADNDSATFTGWQVATSDTDLNVSISSSTPPASTLASGSAYNAMTRVNLKAGDEEDVEVTSITVTRSGLSSDGSFNGVLLQDSSGLRHGNVVSSFSDAKATLSFASAPVVIEAGTTETVTLLLHVSGNSGTVALYVNSASDITAVGADSGGVVDVAGSFPIVGNTMQLTNGTGIIAAATTTVQTVGGGTSVTPTTNDIGETDLDVTKFRISETSGAENMKVAGVTIFNNGSAADSDIANIDLVDQDGNVLATVDQPVNKEIYFDLSADSYVIPEGTNRDFTVRLDIIDGSSRTVNLVIQNDYDVVLYGSDTSSGILSGGFVAGSVGDDTNVISINEGSLTIAKASTSPSGNLAIGATNVTLGEFEVQAFGEDMELQKLTFQVVRTGTPTDLSGTLKVTANDTSIYSVTAADAPYAAAAQKTLSNYYKVESGEKVSLKFVGDISSNAVAADSYQIKITNYQAKRLTSNNFATESVPLNITANVRSVTDSQLVATSNSSYNPVNLVKGGSGVKIGSFQLQAGSSEGVNITAIKVTLASDSDATRANGETGTLITGISNLTIKNGSTSLGSPKSSPSTAGDSFSVSGFSIGASETKTVDVYADVSAGFGAVENYLYSELEVTGGVGQTSQTSVVSSAATGVDIIFLAGGTLTIASNTSQTPVQQVLHAGEASVAIFKFKVMADNAENITLKKLYLSVDQGSGNLADLKLYDGSTQLGSTTQIVNGEAQFSGLTYNVEKAAEKTLTLKATVNASGTLTIGDNVQAGVTYVEYTGASSGGTVYVSGGVASSYAAPNLTVYNGTQFEVGDVVYIDINGNGAIPYTVGGGGAGSEDQAYTVATVAGNVLTFNVAPTGIVSGARLSPVYFASNEVIVHDVEPDISVNAASPSGTQGASSDQIIAVFNVTAQGTRPLSVDIMDVKLSGSWSYDNTSGNGGGYFPAGFELWEGNSSGQATRVLDALPILTSGEAYDLSLDNATVFTGPASVIAADDPIKSGSVLRFDISADPYSIEASTTGYFVIKADTNNLPGPSGQIEHPTLKVTLDGTAGALTGGALTWDYTNVNTVNAATFLGAAPVVSDSYPISGNTLSY